MKKYFVFSTSDHVGYITSQFIQGARLFGAEVTTNLSRPDCDGRFMKADIQSLGLNSREQPSDDEEIIIDETRMLSSFDDLGEGFLNSLCSRSDSERIRLIYSNDDANFISFPSEISCYVPHQIKGFRKGASVCPIPWGITLECIEESRKGLNTKRLPGTVIQNFNSTNNQSVRESLLAALQSYTFKSLRLDERHLQGGDYAEQLRSSQLSMAFGGLFFWPRSDYDYMKKLMSERSLRLDVFAERERRVGVLRWDSFRFWETMAFGCIPIQLDFDIYGFLLPETPIGWQHYVPIDLMRIGDTFDTLDSMVADDFEKIEEMSFHGRSWCIENAHPVKTYLNISGLSATE